MSAHKYLDEEFMKIQDFLTVLTDTLPKLDPHSIKDDQTLIRSLVDQNKAYGRKIINLYESLDNFYKNSAGHSDRGDGQSPDFTSRLHQKIQDYEELIKKLTQENEEFAQQIKQFSKQIESIHSSYQLQTGSRDKSILNQTPSPILKKSTYKSANRDFSFDLESHFINGDYNRAIEALAQNDYKRPPSVPIEKFNNWLVIANRVRDSQFNEILNKLKILIAFSDNAEDEEPQNLDDSLDGHSQQRTIVEKIYHLLDEKIPKLILQNEYRLETQKQKNPTVREERRSVNNPPQWNTANFKQLQEIQEEQEDDSHFTHDQLRLKIRYLNNKIMDLEGVIRDREIEMEVLKDRLQSARGFESPNRLIKENETLFETLENEMKTRFELEAKLQEVLQENEALREKLDMVINDLENTEKRCQELNAHVEENGEVIQKLVQENASLKEQYEFSEKHEDIEKLKEQLQEKENRIKALQEELTLAKDYNKVTPRDKSMVDGRKFIGDTPSEHKNSRDYKSALQLETSLHTQHNLLTAAKQAVNELKSSLHENLAQLALPIPTDTPSTEPYEERETKDLNESQRLVRNNTSVLKELQNDITFLKQASRTLFKGLSERKSVNNEHSQLVQKITQAEEKLVENISAAIKDLSNLTNFIHDVSSRGIGQAEIPKILQYLQSMHDSLTRAIHEFPEFTTELSIDKKDNRSSEFHSTATFFKEKLLKDQSEISSKLKSALQSFEKKQNDEAMTQLAKEIEKNQELQLKIEAKNLIVYRLNLIYTEGIERSTTYLQQLVRLADSEDAQRLLSFVLNEIANIKLRFKDIVGNSKEANLEVDRELRAIEQEYNSQREVWEKQIKELLEANERKLEQYIREIEAERDAHRKTQEQLLESSRRAKISEEYTRENQMLSQKLAEKERILVEKDRAIAEKDRMLEEKSEEIDRMAQKLRRVENEVDQLTNEIQRGKDRLNTSYRDQEELSKEVQRLTDKLAAANRENTEIAHELQRIKEKIGVSSRDQDELRQTVERLKRENHNLVQELNDIVLNKGKDIEHLQRQLEQAKQEVQELKGYKDKTDSVLKRNHDQIESMKQSYFSELNLLKDENRVLKDERQRILADLDKKHFEVNKLNQMLDQLQNFSNKQLDALKQKEEQLTELQNFKRENEMVISDLERKNRELSEKNQKLVESVNQNMYDINSLKAELHKLIDQHNEVQNDLVEMKRKNEEYIAQNARLLNIEKSLTEEKGLLEDKIQKLTEILEVTKREVNNLRELTDQKTIELENKEREIISLKDILKRERDIARESELVGHLKKELKARNEEIELLRKDYQKCIETAERLNIELDTLRVASKLSDQHQREIEKANLMNQTLAVEIETIRKSMKYKEEQYNMEKEAYEREIQLLKKKITDLKSIIESKEANLKGIPKQLEEKQAATASNSKISSSYLQSVIESKDLEIKRLSQIVKNLTENLKDTQETKFKLKK